jgi:hypothetical protein
MRPHSVPAFRPQQRFYFPSANLFFINPTKKEKVDDVCVTELGNLSSD